MPTDRPDVAQQIAQTLIEGFDKHYWLFRETSARAKQRFEDADWAGVQQAVRERIRFYDERVRECVDRLHDELGADTLDDEAWQQAKLIYLGLLVDHRRPELAETFFNSVVTRILHRTYLHNDFIFVGPPEDPAKIKGVKTANEALTKIDQVEARIAEGLRAGGRGVPGGAVPARPGGDGARGRAAPGL